MCSTVIWAGLILVVIIMFKPQICSILNALANVGNKAQKVKYKNLSIDLTGGNPALSGNQQEYASAKHLEYIKAFQSNEITLEENMIRHQLAESKMTEDQAINVLVQHLANANLLIKLLIIDQLIYKEQTKLLAHLNAQIKPLAESELLAFYEEWKNNLENNTDYTFKAFLDFLSQQRLIASGIDGYSIGPIGKEYLGFLILIGRKI